MSSYFELTLVEIKNGGEKKNRKQKSMRIEIFNVVNVVNQKDLLKIRVV